MIPLTVVLHSPTAFRWTAIIVGIPFVVVTSYVLYQRGMGSMASVYVPPAYKAAVVLGREQKPLTTPTEGPLVAKNG